MAESTDKTGAYLKIGFQIALAVAGVIALKKVAEMFGLIKTAAESKVEDATSEATATSTEVTANNPMLSFNPNYSVALLKAFRKKYPKGQWFNTPQLAFAPAEYNALAKKLYDSKSIFGDDEDKLYSVFRRVQTQYQLSVLSLLFTGLYNKDLLEYLKGFTNAEEMERVIDLVKNYPQYYKDKVKF